MAEALIALVLVAGLLWWGSATGRFRRRSADLIADEHEVDTIHTAWVRACEGAGFVRTVDTVSGPTVIPPRLVHIVLGPPTVLTIELQPGQVIADLRALSSRLAPHLGAVALRIEPAGHVHARVTLLPSDPLADTYALDDRTTGPVVLGADEDGHLVEVDEPNRLTHMVVAGSTGSGKSGWLYAFLPQVCRRPDIRVAGVDASGLLFRPLPADEWRVSGLADPFAVEKAVTSLVVEMNRRITEEIPADQDTVTTSRGLPLVLVVFEEWPGTLRALDVADSKVAKRVRLGVARLLAESRKAGMRVVLVAQRAEAAIIGAAERSQCPTRLTFGASSVEDIRLLHPECPLDAAESHVSGPAGVALLSMPGKPLRRVRGPWNGNGYGEYVRRVSLPDE